MRTNMMVKAAAVGAAVPLLMTATVGQASAADRWTYRSSNATASVNWIEMGPLPGGVLGNVHVGYLEVYDGGSVDVYGGITDWTCPEGELPPEGGGGHGELEEEPPATNCELHSERFLYAGDGQVDFELGRRLSSARLTGTLNVEDHGTGTGARPAVDITWTGDGSLTSYSSTGKSSDEYGTYYWKETGTSRQAVIAAGSAIGAMGFTDDADDRSTAIMAQSKIYERSSSR